MFRLIQERECETVVASAFAARALAPGLGVIGSLQRRGSTLNKHRGCVNTVAFTQDGTRLISGSDDLQLIVWDWQRGAPLGLPVCRASPARVEQRCVPATSVARAHSLCFLVTGPLASSARRSAQTAHCCFQEVTRHFAERSPLRHAPAQHLHPRIQFDLTLRGLYKRTLINCSANRARE